jgi:hypothetical protein
MFRVETHHGVDAVVMKLEGQLRGDYAEYARTLVSSCDTRVRLILDLTDVTFVDPAGEDVLTLFGRFGAEFIADNAYSRDLCERLNLRLMRAVRPQKYE